MSEILKSKNESADEACIQLTRSIAERDFAGRYTHIQAGSYGRLIGSEEEIKTIHDISDKQVEKLKTMLQYAKESGSVLALVAGYPCWLKEGLFIKKKPKISLIPWAII